MQLMIYWYPDWDFYKETHERMIEEFGGHHGYIRYSEQVFKEIIDKVDLGTSMEDALTEAVEYIPSNDFRRLLWQILNSVRTGSNISKSLVSVLEQIAREQTIQINKYSKKLNPFAMFYMIIAVILPSLGVTILVVFSSFIKFEFDLTIFLTVAFLLAFIQFMFLSMIKFSRPAVEL